eukprot:6490242-Amphidinium_carterae.1
MESTRDTRCCNKERISVISGAGSFTLGLRLLRAVPSPPRLLPNALAAGALPNPASGRVAVRTGRPLPG